MIATAGSNLSSFVAHSLPDVRHGAGRSIYIRRKQMGIKPKLRNKRLSVLE